MALGADGAELDVQLARGGEVVVVHDFRLNPDFSRDGSGTWLVPPTPRVRDLTHAEIACFDVGRARPGSACAREHPLMRPYDGERIPLLADVVALARSRPAPFWLFVELKTSLFDPALSASPEDLADATVRVLKQADYGQFCVLVGFDWRALRRAKEAEPSLCCWFSTRPRSWFAHDDPPSTDESPPQPALDLLRQWARTGTSPWAAGYDAVHHRDSIVAAIKAAGADGWFPYAADATPQTIAEAHSSGLRVGAWTVNNPQEMQALTANGIDAICTDRPDLLRQSAR